MMKENESSVSQHPNTFQTRDKTCFQPGLAEEHRPPRTPPTAYLTSSRCSSVEEPALQAHPNHQSPQRDIPDLEKVRLSDCGPTRLSQPSLYATTLPCHDEEDEEGVDEHGPKKHVLWILTYLSTLAPLLAILIAVYTLVMTMIFLLLSPLLLCLSKRPLSNRFYCCLAPLPRLQLRLVCSFSETSSTLLHNPSRICTLMLANTFAPAYAIVIAMAAWVSGVFWFHASILGNPDGMDERDDGKEAVLRVRDWWEAWLLQGLR